MGVNLPPYRDLMRPSFYDRGPCCALREKSLHKKSCTLKSYRPLKKNIPIFRYVLRICHHLCCGRFNIDVLYINLFTIRWPFIWYIMWHGNILIERLVSEKLLKTTHFFLRFTIWTLQDGRFLSNEMALKPTKTFKNCPCYLALWWWFLFYSKINAFSYMIVLVT